MIDAQAISLVVAALTLAAVTWLIGYLQGVALAEKMFQNYREAYRKAPKGK